jgi:Protein of unknown function (DUF2642)
MNHIILKDSRTVQDFIGRKAVIEMVSGSRIQGTIIAVRPTHIELDTGIAVLEYVALISIVERLPGC